MSGETFGTCVRLLTGGRFVSPRAELSIGARPATEVLTCTSIGRVAYAAGMPEPRDVETVERVINAAPEAIFALLADPSRHREIDGSGTVHDAKKTPERVKLGDEFGMDMKRGIPYSAHNVVVEFDDDRRIAWQHTTAGPIGTILGSGALWRYELEPVAEGTRVRETWDISHVRFFKPLLRLDRARTDTRKSMEKTLENIENLLTAR